MEIVKTSSDYDYINKVKLSIGNVETPNTAPVYKMKAVNLNEEKQIIEKALGFSSLDFESNNNSINVEGQTNIK